MVTLGYAQQIGDLLAAADLSYAVCAETEPEPTIQSLQPALAMCDANQFDAIIALGGGSPIDSAKAIAILARYGGQMSDYKVPRVVNEKGLPVIAIPTTAGTGSETTRFTVITEETTDEKMLCSGAGFMPQAALVDYELTLSLPPRITADTGIDALTHAIEAYVSRKANAFSDQQALAAMRLIAPYLKCAYEDGSDVQAREQLMLGATLAGIAFSNASVALVHGMSRPIGAFFHVPHGLSNAMLLPSVTRFSLPHASARYADCAKAMGLCDAAASDKEAGVALLEELDILNQVLQVPSPVEFGIDAGRFVELAPVMAQQALDSGSPANNPVVPNLEQIQTLYRSLVA